MKALLVDDEKLALLRLKSMLEREPVDVQVVGMLNDAREVMEAVDTLEPDVVFLDIRLPETDGLELARRIHRLGRPIEIVFVTGYDRYAVEAYEVHPLDYIVKPVNRERLRSTMKYVKKRLDARRKYDQSISEQPKLVCFQHLRMQEPGREPEFLKWRTSKAQELFAYLLHNRSRVVGRDVLFDLLWPEYDLERAAAQLYNTIYAIRGTMKAAGLNVAIAKGGPGAGYRLELGDIRVDAEDWEERLTSLPPLDPSSESEHEETLSGYAGDYLADHDYLWAENERERLRRLWLRHAQNLNDFYVKRRRFDSAEKVNQQVQKLCPLSEQSYFNLMRIYAEIGDKTAVEEQYRLLESKLYADMDAKIGADIIRWYRRWRKAR
ncbi:response regulator [Saccharibacillus sp. CPCC 101409]|uniref:response regulator n=1 Tax=Saccharibacillus sp. CPCC 101409 TaxID=3058041 RepID=UPI002670D71D|nr:response regulator [Saccharibacillus sp. CPCC 101409]MDO3410022.1 response regulator [Saccharibacillus sp. CPCC 101409]